MIDLKRLLKRQNQRVRQALDQKALPEELGVRLLDHLEGLKLTPTRILNIGEGPGWMHTQIRSLFPKSQVIHVDLSAKALRELRPSEWLQRLIGRTPLAIAARADALPIDTASMDLVILQGVSALYDLSRLFKECRRILKKEGLVLFWALGPDSLKEWREASLGSAFYGDPPRFTDMHDLADAASHAGFGSPVVDMETLTLDYASLDALFRDLKTLGGGDALHTRTSGLKTPRALARVKTQLQKNQGAQSIALTLEVVYGHAWNPSALKSESGHPIIPIRSA